MRVRSALLFAAPLLALGACQESGSSLRPAGLGGAPPAASSAATILPADCPPAGATMRTSEGREFSFLGRDPDDAEVCMWTSTTGRGVARQIRGFWTATAETSRFHREGLRPLFPLGAGRTASYTSATNAGFWRYNWRVLGEQRITVPAGEFDVWVVEFTEDSANNTFRGERMFYVDKATNTPVRVDSRVVRGMSAYTPSWQALTFNRPPR